MSHEGLQKLVLKGLSRSSDRQTYTHIHTRRRPSSKSTKLLIVLVLAIFLPSWRTLNHVNLLFILRNNPAGIAEESQEKKHNSSYFFLTGLSLSLMPVCLLVHDVCLLFPFFFRLHTLDLISQEQFTVI